MERLSKDNDTMAFPRTDSTQKILLIALACAVPSIAGVLPNQKMPESKKAESRTHVRAILEQALEAVSEVEDVSKRDTILGHVAQLQARTGNLQEALATAAMIGSEWQRESALMLIAWGQAEAGDRHGSVATAMGIEYGSLRDQALAQLAYLLATSDEVEDALAAVHAMTDPEWIGEALARVAWARAQKGDWAAADINFEQAVEAAVAAEDDSKKVRVLLKIAEMQALLGNQVAAARTVDRAKTTLAQMEAGAEGDSLRAELAKVQAEAGLVGEAFGTQYEIVEERSRRRALGAIAKAQAETGNISGAMATITAIPYDSDKDDFDKTYGLSVVALEQSNEGSFDQALETVSRMPMKNPIRAHTLASIGVAQAGRGDRAGATRTFRQALQEASTVEDEFLKAQAMRIIAVSQAEAGDVSAALRTAETIQTENERGNAFSGIAHRQARRGDARRVLAWVADLSQSSVRALALLGVADGLLEYLQRQEARARSSMR